MPLFSHAPQISSSPSSSSPRRVGKRIALIIFAVFVVVSFALAFFRSNDYLTIIASSNESPSHEQQNQPEQNFLRPPDDYRLLAGLPIKPVFSAEKSKANSPRQQQQQVTHWTVMKGGFGKSLPTAKTWLLVKKRDAWQWFDRAFPPPRPSSSPSWSCSIGNVNLRRRESTLGQYEVKIWKELPKLFPANSLSSKLPASAVSLYLNLSKQLGPGWSPAITPEIRHFTARSSSVSGVCDTQAKAALRKENAKYLATLKAQQRSVLEEMKKNSSLALMFVNAYLEKFLSRHPYPPPRPLLDEGNKSQAATTTMTTTTATPITTTAATATALHPSIVRLMQQRDEVIANPPLPASPLSTHLIPTDLMPQYENFIKQRHKNAFPPIPQALFVPITKNDLQTNSVSINQLQFGCLDDVIAIDGRAPTFSHAMSRRCLDPVALAKKKIFLLGLGHSHTRCLFGMLCMLGNHKWCDDFSNYHFHVAVYPVRTKKWWEAQEFLEVKKMPKNNNHINNDINDNNGSSRGVLVQKNQTRPGGEDEISNNGVQFRLFYSASWYDPRIALIRALKNLIEHSASKNDITTTTTTTTLPEPPNITVFYTPDFGLSKHAELMKKWDQELDSWIEKVRPFFAQVPTHFVVSRGEWDFHFMSPDLSAVAEQTANILRIIHKHFPEAIIILQLPQRHLHFRVPQHMFRYRAVCASEARVQLMREANICGAYLAHKNKRASFEGSKSGLRDSFSSKLVVFDSDAVTRSWMGTLFVDPAGHHYNDVVLEVLAVELRLIASSPKMQRLYSTKTFRQFLKNGDKTCQKILRDMKDKRKKVVNTEWNNSNFIEYYNQSSTSIGTRNSSNGEVGAGGNTGRAAVPPPSINNNNTNGNATSSSSSSQWAFEYSAATSVLYDLPMSRNNGYPAEAGTKEMICTCHQEQEGDDEGADEHEKKKGYKPLLKDERRKLLCDSIRIPPKEFVGTSGSGKN